jgi:uncharacterized membrane protein
VRVPKGIAILGILLLISVILNLFIVGSMVGKGFVNHDAKHDLDARLNAITSAMPDADRPLVDDLVKRHHDELLEKLYAIRSSTEQAGLALRATPFVADAARAAFTTQIARIEDYRAAMQSLLIEAASRISPEGREHLGRFAGGPR